MYAIWCSFNGPVTDASTREREKREKKENLTYLHKNTTPQHKQTLVNVLQTAATTIFHANPEFVATQVRAKVGNNVWVSTVAHHNYFLLNYLNVVAGLQFYHFDGGKVGGADFFRLFF